MASNDILTYLGVLAAPTAEGKRAVATALTGAAELYHLVDAGLDTDAEPVANWLWSAGINPDEAATALPNDILIRDIMLPAIDNLALVVHHGDLDIPFVDQLITSLAKSGNAVIISGVDLTGPVTDAVNGAAGRRAFGLQARYEAAIESARKSPLPHRIAGEVDKNGQLSRISIAGPFAQQSWTLDAPEDAFMVMASIMHMGKLAAFIIEQGPAQPELKRLANEYGLNEKLAA